MFSKPAMAPPMEDAPWLWQPVVPPPPPVAAADVVVALSASAPTFQPCENVEISVAAKSTSVLLLADAIPESELGTAEMPTVGSMNHHFGACKPCAFLHKQGCVNGVNCKFCHLCDPGEKKRRQKLTKAQLQSMKQEPDTMAPIRAA